VRRDAVLLCRTADVTEGTSIQVPKPGTDEFLAVFNLSGTFYVTDDMCTHAMASLAGGEIQNGRIYCPLHGGAFDIATGVAVESPCTDPLRTYEVFAEDGLLYGLGLA
jgi:nitrite reductase/ring-hydroxylating ferredoxin subunit